MTEWRLVAGIATAISVFSSCSNSRKQMPREVEDAQPVQSSLDAGIAVAGCEQLSPSVCYNKGLKLSLSRSLDDRRQSVALLRISCESRVAEACDRLGILLSLDRDLLDERAAIGYYQKACELGDSRSCRQAGDILKAPRPGVGRVARDCPRAVAFYENGCSRGDGPSCSSLGELFAKGCGDLPADKTKARKYQKLGRDWLRNNAP